jgi:hypothetical protein
MQNEVFKKQLESIVQEFKILRSKGQYSDLSDLPEPARQALVTRAIAAVTRIGGADSSYSKQVDRLIKENRQLHMHFSLIEGLLIGLLADVEAGYLQSLVEIVHANLFDDFLEMADHLSTSGYKDAAAVIAGSTLESHLRELCHKNGVPISTVRADGSSSPKKADLINAELTAAGVYSKLDLKNVTAWLDLRNKAAHGQYTEYKPEQVELLISSIREFIARNPA